MILVTGGTGLIGSHLLHRLAIDTEKVKAIKRQNSDLNTVKSIFKYYSPENYSTLFDRIEWVDAELNNYFSLEDALEGCTQVYHCAATVSFNPKDKKNLWATNIEGTANLVNAALEQKIDRFCHVSSTAAIGRPENSPVATEQTEWKNSKSLSNYSITKYGAEREVWRGAEEGLNVVIVNPSVILGPGNWEKSSIAIFRKIYTGLNYFTKGANAFVDVRDVVEAMLRLTNSDIASERYLVAGNNVHFKTLFNLIAQKFGVRAPQKEAKTWMTNLIWRLAKITSLLSGKAPVITKETARSANTVHEYSSQKLIDTLQFKFRPLEETVENTVEFIQEKYIK